jgi:ferrous iron transport protein B
MSDCHSPVAQNLAKVLDVGTPVIALAGQPNMGKSTLFNLLTGLNQHVGNWPGKTVEKREGHFKLNGRSTLLVDLPGTYSLTANSPEEVIAREFILREKPSLTLAVVSAANLERSLYLVAELAALKTPTVVALNMLDVAEQEGIAVDAQALSMQLGLPVVPIIASRAIGVQQLLTVIEEVISNQKEFHPGLPRIREDHLAVMSAIEDLIHRHVPPEYPLDWIALKLLEGDSEITAMMRTVLPEVTRIAMDDILRQHDDAFLAVASARYEWIGRIIQCVVSRPRVGQIGLTERLDRWATHPVLGLLILAGVLGLVFWLVFTISAPIQQWLDQAVIGVAADSTAQALANTPVWLRGLVVDGAIGGVGAVLTFLPVMVIFFAAFAVLEDVGYMARAAYVMDNFMHAMGLHGKSFLPLFLGFGCNVPAVIGTRVIDSWHARLLTILIAPLVPCTARMAVVAFIAPAFFGRNAFWVTWGIVVLSLVILFVLGAILNRTIFKGERSAFIMEIPLYHTPNPRTILILVWQRTLAFLKKAGTAILAISIVIWIFSYLPGGDLETSYLARLGGFIEPVGKWMGFDWRLIIALLSSFPAKENSIATLGVLFGSSAEAGLSATLASTYSPATVLAFLVVSVLFIPCAATVAAIRQETHSWRWVLLGSGLMLLISVVFGIAVFNLATMIGL